MTDFPIAPDNVPSRLATSARLLDGELVMDVLPQPGSLAHGSFRASVLTFAIDCVAGIAIDDDPACWAFTTDLSIRMRPHPAPERCTATCRPLRRGRRTSSAAVEVTADDGRPIAAGAIGFASVPRRDDDPPKISLTPAEAAVRLHGQQRLEGPVRDDAGIVRVDPAEGVVEIPITPLVVNPAGTLQGAMVALVAEAAAEDLVTSRFDVSALVVDLDIRYLGPARSGVVRTRSRLLGSNPGDPVEVELYDPTTDRVSTFVHARAVVL